MVELTEAFCSALTQAGIPACSAKGPDLSPRLKESAVAVSVKELAHSPGGFSAYLGIHEGQELYGMRLNARMLLEILSPVHMGAAECRACLDRVSVALAQGVEGVSILEIVTHAPEYDPVGDYFLARLEADCRCWLCAGSAREEPEELTHFILKGALT